MQAIESVLMILMVISLGSAIAWRMKLNETNSGLISKLVTSVTLPAYMIANLMSNYDRTTLITMAPGLAIPVLSMIICILLSIICAKIFKVPESRRGTFSSMFSLSNAIFIGLPVNLMLFGEKSIPFVLLYYISNTCFFWTYGVYSISADGHKTNVKILSLSNFKKIFSPPLIGFLVATALILIGITLPKLIIDVCKMVGGMTTPLSMIFIGIILFCVDWKEIRPDIEMFLLLAARFVIAPGIVILLCRVLPGPVLLKQVMVIQTSMPIMTQTSIIARAYNADYKYAAVMTSVTTVASLVTIPAWMFIMNHFNIFGM
jgi:malate permease and related proteins